MTHPSAEERGRALVDVATEAVPRATGRRSAYNSRVSSAANHDMQSRLETLEALTDTSLKHLEVDDLLAELLTRVREILGADTAAVLLVDESSRALVAT